MAAVNQVCATILDNVINSGLDFSINQTPYSIHFSLRKKYSRNSSNKTLLNSPSLNTALPQETLVDNFRQELLHTRNEYVKLYNMYTAEQEARSKLDQENKELIENLAKKEENFENVKSLRNENKSLKEKLENKRFEVRHFKTDLENEKKEKNVLSVALKASKAGTKEQRTEFEKKVFDLEKKVVELNDFKQRKHAEERDLKIMNRKELKKANQKLKKEKKKDISVEDDQIKYDINLNPVENTILETKVESDCDKDTLEEKPDLNHNLSAEEKPEPDEEVAHSVEETEPKLMSKEEKEAFLKEIFAKVDKALGK